MSSEHISYISLSQERSEKWQKYFSVAWTSIRLLFVPLHRSEGWSRYHIACRIRPLITHTAWSTQGWKEDGLNLFSLQLTTYRPLVQCCQPVFSFSLTFLSQWVSFGKKTLVILGWFIACRYDCLFFFKARGSRVLVCISTNLRTYFSVTSPQKISLLHLSQ